MEARELRIGNWIQDKWSTIPSKVWIIDTTETSTQTKSKPLPITEQLLLDFGFKRHHDDYSNEVIFIKNVPNNTEFEWGVYPNELGSGIKVNNRVLLRHIHQLQNLYYALTGEELTFKNK